MEHFLVGIVQVCCGIDDGVSTIVFPNTNNGQKLFDQTDVDRVGGQAFAAWGGWARFQKCVLGMS